MLKGGYQILNMKGHAFSAGATSATINGTHAAISGAGGKRLVVSGFVYGEDKFNDMGAFAQAAGTGFTVSTDSGYSFSVSDADLVTVVAPAGG